MNRTYDIFEKIDGDLVWRTNVVSRDQSILKLKEMAAQSSGENEFVVMYLPTKEVVAHANGGGFHPKVRKKRLVGQVGYDPKLTMARTDLLRAHGYEVVSAIGNEAAKFILGLAQEWDFFIVGYAAPKDVREEMVAWLKSRFPGVPILALNPPTTLVLRGADYNVKHNGAELWLPLVRHALRQVADTDSAGQ